MKRKENDVNWLNCPQWHGKLMDKRMNEWIINYQIVGRVSPILWTDYWGDTTRWVLQSLPIYFIAWLETLTAFTPRQSNSIVIVQAVRINLISKYSCNYLSKTKLVCTIKFDQNISICHNALDCFHFIKNNKKKSDIVYKLTRVTR